VEVQLQDMAQLVGGGESPILGNDDAVTDVDAGRNHVAQLSDQQ
jgi:hypothetical protein